MSSPNSPIEPRLLKGFRDLLPEDLTMRNQLIDVIASTLRLYGFSQIETPALEYAEILTGKLGGEGEKLLYQFTDHGNRHVAMRYDFTVPLARVVAQNQSLPLPFKRFQVGPVWRADNTQKGRYREFYQFDFDTVGSNTPLADGEIIAAMHAVLTRLNVGNFTIRVNDRRYLESIAHQADLASPEVQTFYLGLDKWDKIGGLPEVKKFWINNGITEQKAELLSAKIMDNSFESHPANRAIANAISMGASENSIKIDPSIVRGLDYYTGIVFETTLDDAPEFGSVFSGGRYDGLIGRFSKNAIPAVGASVGLDRLIAALQHLDRLKPSTHQLMAYVTIFNENLRDQSLSIVRSLRESDIAAEMHLDADDSLGKQLKHASARNAKYAIILGPDEMEKGVVSIKELSNGTTTQKNIDDLIKSLR